MFSPCHLLSDLSAVTTCFAAVKKAFTVPFVYSVNELYECTGFHRRKEEPGGTTDTF